MADKRIKTNLIIDGTIIATNLSGTNTGDQNLSGLVPYTGATGDVDLGVNSLKATELWLAGGTGDQGKISWNADEETIDVIQNGAVLQLGQELQTHCRNNTASEIPNGTVVMATGTIGASGRITIAPYDNVADAKYVLGVATEDIAVGGDGKVTKFGKVRGVDTSAWAEGTVLYTTTGGGFTSTEPITGIKMPIAFVVISHASVGTLMVRVTAINENEFHNDARALTWLGTRSTTDLPEGSNLYYTEAKVSANTTVVDTADTLSTHITTHPAPTVRDTRNQIAGTYSTDIHSNITALNAVSGVNTGDNAPNSLYSNLVSNATHTGDVTGSTALTIADGVIDIAHLGDELAGVATLPTGNNVIDFKANIHYDKTLDSAWSPTFTNPVKGKSIVIYMPNVVSSYTLTLPSSVKGDISDFDSTLTNQLTLYCLDDATPVYSVTLLNW